MNLILRKQIQKRVTAHFVHFKKTPLEYNYTQYYIYPKAFWVGLATNSFMKKKNKKKITFMIGN